MPHDKRGNLHKSIGMSYGKLPKRDAFYRAWDLFVGKEETFEIKSRGRDLDYIPSGAYDRDEIWDFITELTGKFNEDGDDHAGELASALLDQVGFEWI